LRQMAAEELAQRLEWRQLLHAYLKRSEQGSGEKEILDEWVGKEAFFDGTRLPLNWIFYAYPFVFISVATAVMIFFSWKMLWIPVIPVAIVLFRSYKKVTAHLLDAEAVEKRLAQFQRAFLHIEGAGFDTEYNGAIRDRLFTDGVGISRRLGKLQFILSQLNVRQNPFAIILQILFLWDLFWIHRIDIWKAKYAGLLKIAL
jgi:hypothetical protein